MAHSKIKAGGPTRGRRRVKRMGMGSGRAVAQAKTEKKRRTRG